MFPVVDICVNFHPVQNLVSLINVEKGTTNEYHTQVISSDFIFFPLGKIAEYISTYISTRFLVTLPLSNILNILYNYKNCIFNLHNCSLLQELTDIPNIRK